jgi:MFS family permease
MMAKKTVANRFVPLKGPTIAPAMGGYTTILLSWEWTLRICFIFTAALLPFALLLPESHGPTLLARRSKRLREETGQRNLWAQHGINPKPTRTVVAEAVRRPFSQSSLVRGM